jgi:PAS domain S-box-containing protein
MKADSREQSPRNIMDLLDCQRRVLDRIATGAPLDEVLVMLVTLVERMEPAMRCAILRTDRSGERLEFAVAPNIPDDFKACVGPVSAIRPEKYNCSRAAFYRKPVYTEDVALDEHWLACRDVALRDGLRAIWSTPILLDDDTLLGTFAMFHEEPGLPSEEQIQLIEMSVQLARVAIQSKQHEERLRAREQELRDVIDNIPTIAWTTRPDGPGDFTNRSWREYTGQTAEEAKGWGWVARVHPEDAEGHLAKWKHSVASGEPLESEVRYRRADGVYRWFLTRGVPLRDQHGKVQRWYGILADIEDRKRAEEASQKSAQRLERLSHRLLTVQEEERRRLSRELHDQLGVTLTALSINLGMLKGSVQRDAHASARVDDSAELVKSAAAAIENMVADLRPPMLDDHGLAAALEWYGRQLSARVGVDVTVRAVEPDLRVPPDAAIALFRIAQEALNNVAKHAGAERVWINLWRKDAEFVMSISDDGIGLQKTEDSQRSGLGMTTMRERAQAIGGRFAIEPLPEGGTRVTVGVPL